jgi:hypothetical protein
MRHIAWVTLLARASALLLAVGCSDDLFSDNTPLCVPGNKEKCLSDRGKRGERSCDADGLDWGACEDLATGGAPAE